MFLMVQDKEQIQESGNQESRGKNQECITAEIWSQEERIKTDIIENCDSKKVPVS